MYGLPEIRNFERRYWNTRESLRWIAGVVSGRMQRIRPRRGKNARGVLESGMEIISGMDGDFSATLERVD